MRPTALPWAVFLRRVGGFWWRLFWWVFAVGVWRAIIFRQNFSIDPNSGHRKRTVALNFGHQANDAPTKRTRLSSKPFFRTGTIQSFNHRTRRHPLPQTFAERSPKDGRPFAFVA